MRKKKLPKDAKARKKLAKCLEKAGWPPLDVNILLGYSIKKFVNKDTRLNCFQYMVNENEDTRKMMVWHYLEKYDIRAEISK